MASTDGGVVELQKRMGKPTQRKVESDQQQRRKSPSKTENPYCKRCNTYVQMGVLCEIGQRWWHYGCANTTEAEVKSIREFKCEEHMDNELSISMKTLEVRTNSYTLKQKDVLKKKFKSLSAETEIDVKRDKKTYTLAVNAVMYEILVENLYKIGADRGAKIEKVEKDQEGTESKAQFTCTFKYMELSVSCFHTTSKIMFQLKKNQPGRRGWTEEQKMEKLDAFISQDLTELIKRIESSPEYKSMLSLMEERLKSQMDGNQKRQHQQKAWKLSVAPEDNDIVRFKIEAKTIVDDQCSSTHVPRASCEINKDEDRSSNPESEGCTQKFQTTM